MKRGKMKINKLVNNINLKTILIYLDRKNILRLPDDLYIKILYKKFLHLKLNLKNPKTLNEKLQWLKLYDRKDIYTTMVDKQEVKKFVSNKIGKEYIIPTIGIYEKFDDIDFSKLPEQFVIKCTHDSGSSIICNNKAEFDIKKAKNKINKNLKHNFYYDFREWPYKNIKPRIIVEKYMGKNLNDYKIQCFNGKIENIFVCVGRGTKKGVRYHYFDKEWNYLDYCPYDDINPKTFQIEKPKKLAEMLKIAEILSEGYPEMRVDLYYIDNKIYFGEITFFTNSGFDTTITQKADRIMGENLEINIK